MPDAESRRRFAKPRLLALGAVAITLIILADCPKGYAWDSRTHELITRLAAYSLPPSALADSFRRSAPQLEVYSVWPDTVLREKYGEAEARRHYINLEYFGRDPFAELDPSLMTMESKFGRGRMLMAGTLPWTIEAESSTLAAEWRAGDCSASLMAAGILAHYVGDASQPLHSTRYYDGFSRADRGVHARFEGAVDRDYRMIARLVAPQVHVEKINSVWTPAIGEIRRANALVNQVVASDRAVRAEGYSRGYAYDEALMSSDKTMVVQQVADAASSLASIWLYEWDQAGQPEKCVGAEVPTVPGNTP